MWNVGCGIWILGLGLVLSEEKRKVLVLLMKITRCGGYK